MKVGKHFYSWGTIEGFRSDIVSIGDYVILGIGSVIITHCPISFYNGEPTAIIIGNNVYIGTGVAILPNVTIGDNVVIGAGSVVSSSIPSNVIAAGNPCRVIRTLTEKESTRIRLMTEQKIVADGTEPKWD
jgi:acetyltransferase-like isoleucine patch superfamily enzyme